jgi:hypothetical protein
MIARIWAEAVRQADGTPIGVGARDDRRSGYLATPGNHGAWMLRRDVDHRAELCLHLEGGVWPCAPNTPGLDELRAFESIAWRLLLAGKRASVALGGCPVLVRGGSGTHARAVASSKAARDELV